MCIYTHARAVLALMHKHTFLSASVLPQPLHDASAAQLPYAVWTLCKAQYELPGCWGLVLTGEGLGVFAYVRVSANTLALALGCMCTWRSEVDVWFHGSLVLGV